MQNKTSAQACVHVNNTPTLHTLSCVQAVSCKKVSRLQVMGIHVSMVDSTFQLGPVLIAPAAAAAAVVAAAAAAVVDAVQLDAVQLPLCHSQNQLQSL